MGKNFSTRSLRLRLIAGAVTTLPVLLTGCMLAGQPPNDIDVADAVPKAEPRSQFGNPPSYQALGKRYVVLASADGYVARGTASWYGPDFNGKRASSGETYNMYSMTAAHPTLPLPSYVKVTNLENHRTAIVRINDRGPFKNDRIIDLSYAAARKLGIWQNGTAYVEVRAITPPHNGDEADRLMMAESAPAAAKTETVVQQFREADSLPERSAAASFLAASSPATTTYALPPPAASPSPALIEDPASYASPAESNTLAYSVPPPVPIVASYVPAAELPAAPSLPAGGQIYIQVGAFSQFENADSLRGRVAGMGVGKIDVAPSELDNLYHVRVGPLVSQSEADRVIGLLDAHGMFTHRMIHGPLSDAAIAGAQKPNAQTF